MAAGAAAILAGMVCLWRGTAPVAAAWILCLGALAPTLLIARSAPLAIVWAVLAMRSAVRRSDVLRAGRGRVALG
jgi:membrane protein implicated in regulation of membrane protease activity